jgi:hypothetical protein
VHASVVPATEELPRTEVAIHSPVEEIAQPKAAVILDPIRGRVLDARGNPLVGIGLGFSAGFSSTISPEGIERPPVLTRNAENGEFELESERSYFTMMSEKGWIPIAGTQVTEKGEVRSNVEVVLAPSVVRTGRAFNAEDVELEGVRVSLDGPELLDYPGILDQLAAPTWEATKTSASGEFAMSDLPAESGSLLFELDGYESTRVEISDLAEEHIEVTLEASVDLVALSGFVLSPGDVPVPNALVGIGSHTVHSGEEGEYRLSLPCDSITPDARTLYAAAYPWQTKTDRALPYELAETTSGSLERNIVFDAESLGISGVVVDFDGQPVAGLLVYLWHEGALSGDMNAEDLAQHAEAPVLDIGPGMRAWCKTDSRREFDLEGLRDRDYKLRIYDRVRKSGITVDGIRGGSHGHRFTLPTHFILPVVSGRVLDSNDQPVVDAYVRALVPEFLSHHQYLTVSSEEFARTDGEGRFVLHDVSGQGATINVSGENLVTAQHYVKSSEPTGIEIRMGRRCHFRVIVDDANLGATGFHVLDADGEKLMVSMIGVGAHTSSNWGQIQDGRTRVLSTTERARTIVLYAPSTGLKEVARKEVSLAAEGVTEIRF